VTGRAGRPAAEIVAEALTATPQPTTAAGLAARTGLGGSTVGKVLTLLEEQGRARRTPGGRDAGRRLPDQWAPVTPATAQPHHADKHATAVEPEVAHRASPPHARASRLGRGQLDVLVLDQLRVSGDQAITAGAVAKALGRSAGAVSNCCSGWPAASR
jgi:hypothetical protein